VTLIAEVGDLTRFDTPRKLMSYSRRAENGYGIPSPHSVTGLPNVQEQLRPSAAAAS
jgi:hypothetical protein